MLHGVDKKLLGMEEGITHVLEFGDIVRADLLAVLHGGANLGYELAELVDTSSNLVEGAGFKVLQSGGDVGNEGVDILDASLKVINVLSLECTNEDTVDQLDHVKSRDSKRASNILGVKFWASKTTCVSGHLPTAISRIELGMSCCGEKS